LLAIFVGASAFVVANNFHDVRSRSMALVDSALSKGQAPEQVAAAPAIPVLATAEPRDVQASVAKIISEEPVGKPESGSGVGTASANIGLPVPTPLPELAVKSTTDTRSASSPAAAMHGSAETPAKKPTSLEKARTGKAARQATPKPRSSLHHATVRRKDDRDVDLIAALLTRVSSADAAEKPAKSAVSPKSRNVPTRQKNSPVTSSGEKPNPALVLNPVHESLGTLVRRCRTRGLVEGELCRLRVCSGSWGKDAACPASGLPPEN
jgi:hypothetical protein